MGKTLWEGGRAGMRSDRVDALLSDVFDGAPPLFALALARMLAIRLERAVRDPASLEDAVVWIGATCAAHRFDARVVRVLRSLPAALGPTLGGTPEAEVAVARMAAAIETAVAAYEPCGDWKRDPDREIDGAIGALLMRLDATDVLSAEHSRAVSLWCRRIATRLDLADEATLFVARCGLLHDVGKASTPAPILNAARALTADEWAIMRDHTTAGAAMLAGDDVLRRFEPAARSHHERLDGKGYPDRLTASQIPLAIRIVSVADSFNAMVGRRPYRLPLSPARALEQLHAHRGTQFDPAVVEAMTDIIEHAPALEAPQLRP